MNIKLSPFVKKYEHHNYLEPELRKMVEEGTTDVLDLTFDADEVRLFDTHSLIKPFLKQAPKLTKELVKYYEEDPLFQDLVGPAIIKYHQLKHVTKEQVFIGVGNYGLFRTFISFLAAPGVMIGNGPQFPELPSYYTALGRPYKSVYNMSWEFPIEEILNEIKTNKDISFIFMDLPSNTIGNYIPLKETRRIIEAAAKKGIIVYSDEAYSNYLPPQDTAAQYVHEFPNVIMTRSLSKAFDLGGIRFGYAVMSKEIAEQFKKIHAPFESSVFSVLLAKYIFEHKAELETHLQQSRTAIQTYRKKTADFFKSAFDMEQLPSHPYMPQMMFYKKGTNLFKFFFDRKVVVRSGKPYQFTCPEMDDQYVRLRPPLTEKTFKEMVKRLTVK